MPNWRSKVTVFWDLDQTFKSAWKTNDLGCSRTINEPNEKSRMCPSLPLTKCIVYTCQTVWPSYLIYCAGQSRQLRNRCWNLERTYFVFVILCISVVNALLHKGFSNPYQSRYNSMFWNQYQPRYNSMFSNPYQSRYNSIAVYYQCQTRHNLSLS